MVHGHKTRPAVATSETAIRGKAALQAPGEQYGFAQRVMVWQATRVESGHSVKWTSVSSIVEKAVLADFQPPGGYQPAPQFRQNVEPNG